MAGTSLPRDFREFLQSLRSHGVDYLLVGGWAVGHHGHPRATGDMDVWVDRSPANAARLLAALRDFGFGSLALDAGTFQAPDQVVQLGVPPLRIDILTSVTGLEFAACRGRAEEAVIDGVPVRVIGLDDLRRNKRATGRPRDLDDLQRLG
jgi:predicted nucleotidyltransferase